MRIAIIKSNYTPYGGGEKYTTWLINAFVKKGMRVDVITAEPVRWENTPLNINWVSLKQFRHNNLLRLMSFNSSVKRHLKKTAYDCILGMDRTEYQTHLRMGGGCHIAWLRRRCEEVSSIRCMSFRLNPFHRKMIEIEKRVLLSDKLKTIFCNSHLVKNEIIDYYPQAEKKIMVIHNGVEWDELSSAFNETASVKQQILKSLALRTDRYYFLFLGSGFERKGLEKAIKALGLLPPFTDLIVVGKDKNEKKYKTLAKKTGLAQRVHFFGPQRNVVPFYQAADAFILPTIYDPFSNASLEALAMGLYTVTSYANGCSEVIKDGAGYLIKDLRNTVSVAEAMNTALQEHLSREEIRESVHNLDFDNQLNKIVVECISENREYPTVKNREMKKVVILHSEVHKDWSGEPIRVLEETIGMDRRGHRVIIAAPPDSELIKRAAAAGITTEPIIMKKWISYPYSLMKAMRILIRHQVDIVNTHASFDTWIFALAAKLLGKKLIRTRHMSLQYNNSPSTKFIYRLPDHIITCSGEKGRQVLLDHFQLAPQKVISIPSSPDCEKFNPEKVAPAETFGIAPGEKVIGMISSLRQGKGHAHFIESMPAIIRKTGGAVKFLIVGNGNPALLNELSEKAEALGVRDKCIFTGYREDIPEMLSLMDIFVLPSLSEGTPQALLQAMAMGLPVISCPVGGITELLDCSSPPDFSERKYHVTSRGILIPTGNPSALSAAIIHFLENQTTCREIGQKNRLLIIEKYSSNLMFAKIEKIYEKLLQKD